jgi:hypothetical protein
MAFSPSTLNTMTEGVTKVSDEDLVSRFEETIVSFSKQQSRNVGFVRNVFRQELLRRLKSARQFPKG